LNVEQDHVSSAWNRAHIPTSSLVISLWLAYLSLVKQLLRLARATRLIGWIEKGNGLRRLGLLASSIFQA
jgi:hypothetical protein